MGLDRVPDLAPKATEIDDPLQLVHRLLYREGRVSVLFSEDEFRPRGERESFLRAITESNKADLRRLEQLVGSA